MEYREKGRDLTQSRDKSPYTNRNGRYIILKKMKKINGFRIGKGFGCLAQKQKFYDWCTTLQFLRQSAKLSNMYWCLWSTILLLIAYSI